MTAQQTHTCECGFTWLHGLSGSHICGPFYRERIAALIKERDEAVRALEVGAAMANVLFNFAQKCGDTLTGDDVAMFDALRHKWDAARPSKDRQTIENLKAEIERSGK